MQALFWVAMAIVKISDVKLFSAAVTLIGTIIKMQDHYEGFKKGLEECFNAAREGPIDQIVSKLDQISGLSFRSSFSFGVACHLLKGLKHPKTKEQTAGLLISFLEPAVKHSVGTNILGYIAALLPVEGELTVLRDLEVVSGGKHLHQYFYTEQLLPDLKHAALLFTLLVTILQNTEKEHEQLFIYNALKEGVEFMPEAFSVIETILFPMMSDVLQKSQNPELLEAVHSIMKSVYSYQQQTTKPRHNRMFLNEIGYHKLPDCAQFNIEPEAKREITKLVILLLENLLKEVQQVKGPVKPQETKTFMGTSRQ